MTAGGHRMHDRWDHETMDGIEDGYPRSRMAAWAESSLWLIGMGATAFGAALFAEWALVLALG